MSTDVFVDFRDAGFTYDGEAFVFRHLNLAVPQGQFLCLLGGNGSGKSTLAKHINALLLPDEGEVDVFGCDTRDAEQTYFIRSNAGLVFQNPDDQLVASLIENDVAFGPENLGIPNPELRERVTRALAEVGLQGFETHETNALSGGQKQRVAIAGVLAMDPAILILDEATAMLDPRGRAGLMRVVRELHERGMTVVMITHFMEEAACADRVVVLDGGQVRMDGAPQEVLVRADELRTLSLEVPFACRSLARAAGRRRARFHLHYRRRPEGGAMRLAFEDVSYSYEGGEAKKKRRRKKDAARQADWGNAPDAVWALRDVSFAVEPGEFFGVAGHTGSGKSTLIQHMNGLVHPTCGRVLADGRDLAEQGDRRGGAPTGGARLPVSREPAVRQHRLRRRGLRAAQHGA